MSEWTREHDRLLAEVAEGLDVTESTAGHFVKSKSPYSLDVFTSSSTLYFVEAMPSYNTDPAAVLRAYEAWRAKDPMMRRMQVIHETTDHTVVLINYNLSKAAGQGIQPLFIDALRWALWMACGGKA